MKKFFALGFVAILATSQLVKADADGINGYSENQCKAIALEITSLNTRIEKDQKCWSEASSTLLKMKQTAILSRDPNIMDDPSVKAAFEIVIARKYDCSADYNKASALVKAKSSEYDINCKVLDTYLPLSDSSLLSKASNKELGRCALVINSKSVSCPYAVQVGGKGYPISKGCQKRIADVANALRDALKDGVCF